MDFFFYSDKNSRLQEIMARTQCIPDFPDLMSNTQKDLATEYAS